MNLDYETLDIMRRRNPAWRFLRADHAPLAAAFLHTAFVEPNNRVLAESELAEALEDEMFKLRERLGPEKFPKSAVEYLNEWADPAKEWLRKFYPPDSDEPHYDLTPATEKAITWLGSLAQRKFVGTESRLLTLVDLLEQIKSGSETDPEERIADLRRRKAEIESQIERIQAGELPMLDETKIRDRFQQFVQMSRDLLADFREVEQNFRTLDREVRERITLWRGPKNELLDDIMARRDAIADSDQGRSFQAFWDFLMSSDRREELTNNLARVMSLPAIAGMSADSRMRRIHYDWQDAGEHTLRTVRQLSQQLRRFVDDQVFLENRRIMDILQSVEENAVALRNHPPEGPVMEVDGLAAEFGLPFERPLFSTPRKPLIADVELEAGDEDLDTAALFAQVVVDKERLARHVRRALQDRSQITLRELCTTQPLEQGLAELLAYLQLSVDEFRATVDEETVETVSWRGESAGGAAVTRSARIPRVIFVK